MAAVGNSQKIDYTHNVKKKTQVYFAYIGTCHKVKKGAYLIQKECGCGSFVALLEFTLIVRLSLKRDYKVKDDQGKLRRITTLLS